MITVDQVEEKWLKIFDNDNFDLSDRDLESKKLLTIETTPRVTQIMVTNNNEITLTINYKLTQ